MKIGCSTTTLLFDSTLLCFTICFVRQTQAFFAKNPSRLIPTKRGSCPSQTSKRLFSSHPPTRTSLHMSLSLSSPTAPSSSSSSSSSLRFVDIGANLLEERFTKGIYRGTFRHEADLDLIWQRARAVGCRRIVLTAGTLEESRRAIQVAREWNQHTDNPGIIFSCTVGIHPTRCQQEFVEGAAKRGVTANDVLQELVHLATQGQMDGTVVAIGEIGLDYDRLEFCPKMVQQEFLVRQLQTLAATTGLPLFLHNRSVGRDLCNILVEHRDCWKAGGVVHSFDDSAELAMAFMQDLNLYIGLNGCSLRSTESLEVCRQALPLERILLETDCPYCEVRATHPGHVHVQTTWPAKAEKKFERGQTVKNRTEPCHIIQIAEVVAAVKQVPLTELAETVYQNSCRLYGWSLEEA